MAHILVVDDERSICELLEITFRKEGHRVEVALNGEAARRKLESSIFDIVISDIRMPDTTGVDLLQFCREISPSSYFMLITGVPTVETAIAAINAGADRYVIKDHDLVDQLRRAVRQVEETLKLKHEAGYLRRELRRLTGQDNIIGHSPKMRAIFDMITTVAPQKAWFARWWRQSERKRAITNAMNGKFPSAAIVYTGPRRLVFVDLGHGRFRPEEVSVGAESNGMYEVLSGLQPGDQVATSGVFLIAAEARISTASRYWDSPESPVDGGGSTTPKRSTP